MNSEAIRKACEKLLECVEEDCENSVCSQLGSVWAKCDHLEAISRYCCVCYALDWEDMCDPCKTIFKERNACPECKEPCSNLGTQENALEIDEKEVERCCGCIRNNKNHYPHWYVDETDPTHWETFYDHMVVCEHCESRSAACEDSDQEATELDVGSGSKRKLGEENGGESGKPDQKKPKI